MREQKKKQNGITLIALVISIIVMLILAGVSLNMTVGDNGIIKQAQSATYLQSCAVLEEYFNQKYVELYSKNNSETENKIDMFINDNGNLSKLIQRAKDTSYFFIDINTGNTYYYIEKNALPKDIRDSIKGGETSLTNKTIWASFEDIYGITSDLKVYYCSDSSESRVGAGDETLVADLNRSVAGMESGSTWATQLGISNRDVTLNDLSKIKDLDITSSVDLKLLYNFGSLKKITFRSVNLENISGIENSPVLNEVIFLNSVIGNYSSLGKCENLERIYFELHGDVSEQVANEEIRKFSSDDLGIGKAELPKLAYFGIYGLYLLNKSVADYYISENSYYMSNVSNITPLGNIKSFENLKYIYLHQTKINSISCFSNCSKLIRADLYRCINLKNLSGLENKPQMTFLNVGYCALETLDNLTGSTSLATVYVNSNSNLKSLKGIENSNSKISYIQANDCSLGSNESTTVKGDNDSLKVLANNSTLTYLNVENNQIVWVDYLSNENKLSSLYLKNNRINGDSILAIKSKIINCGTNSSIPAEFSLFLLDDNIAKLDLSGQRVEVNNFKLIKSKSKLRVVNISNLVLTDSSNNELTQEETNTAINEVLATLPALKHLNATGIGKLYSIEFVKGNPQILELCLNNTGVTTGVKKNNQDVGLEILNNNTTITTLQINNASDNLSNLVPLIHRLYSFNCWWGGDAEYFCHRYVRGFFESNSTALASLNNSTCGLQKLGLTNSAGSVDLSKCTTLTNVYIMYGSLRCTLPASVTFLHLDADGNFLANIPAGLVTADFVNGTLNQNVLNNLAQTCPNLKQLSSGNTDSVTDLAVLENAVFKNTIETLTLVKSSFYGEYKNFSKISNCVNLKSVSFNNMKLEDISGIEKLNKLEYLRITNCKTKEIPDLSNLVNLKTLYLYTNNISELHGIENLTKLTYINLNDNPLKDIIQFTDNQGNLKTVTNLSLLKQINQNNKSGELIELYLQNNSITDFTEISGLQWKAGSKWGN